MTETLTCQELVELITAYLDDALSPGDRARFEAHLAECDGCTNYLHQMQTTIALAGRLSEEAIPETGKEKLLQLFSEWKKGRPS
jgi:anti-sigma factor RsiW